MLQIQNDNKIPRWLDIKIFKGKGREEKREMVLPLVYFVLGLVALHDSVTELMN